MPTTESARPSLFAPLLLALRTYWPAILIIQGIGLATVLIYYRVAAVAETFAQLAEWKAQGGLVFMAVANVVSGGVLPEHLKRVFRPPSIRPPGVGELAHQFAMWAALGVFVDVFYGLQAHWFGPGTDAGTILIKVVVDQLVFTPLVGLPFIVGWFTLREVHYRPRAWLAAMAKRSVITHSLQLWVSCLAFWPVMLLIIYALPPAASSSPSSSSATPPTASC